MTPEEHEKKYQEAMAAFRRKAQAKMEAEEREAEKQWKEATKHLNLKERV